MYVPMTAYSPFYPLFISSPPFLPSFLPPSFFFLSQSTRCFLKSSNLKETSEAWDSYLHHILTETPGKYVPEKNVKNVHQNNVKNVPEKKIIALQEMQSVVLWRIEISTASRTLFLSDRDIIEKWEELLPVITKECSVESVECSSHGMWNILYGIVTMEIQIRNQIRKTDTDIPSSKESKESSSKESKEPKRPMKDKLFKDIPHKENLHHNVNNENNENNVNNGSMMVDLSGALNVLNLEKIDSIGLELLSKAICLSVQSDVCEGNMENIRGRDRVHSSMNSKSSNSSSRPIAHSTSTNTSTNSNDSVQVYSSSSLLLIERITALCALICSPGDTTDTPKTPQEASKYGSFLARTYSSCLKYLQNYFQNGMKEKCLTGCNEPPPQTPQGPQTPHTPHTASHTAQIFASKLFQILFNSLRTPLVWINNEPAILQTLRALGNCLSHLPLGSCDGFLGVNLCSGLGDCVMRLIGGEFSQDILTTCLTLVSLVGGRCMSNKLYIASSQLLACTLVAVDQLVTSKKIRIIGLNSTEPSTTTDPPPVPLAPLASLAFTVERSVMNRLVGSLTTACAISTTIDDINNINKIDSNNDNTNINPTIFDVCTPILTSTYGTDFLYGLCSEILLRVGDYRSVNTTTGCSAADHALTMIIRMFQHTSDSGVIPSNESSLMILYAQSHCLWSVPVPSDGHDDSSDDVIKSLRGLKFDDVGVTVGGTSASTVTTVRGKSKGKKAKDEDTPSTCHISCSTPSSTPSSTLSSSPPIPPIPSVQAPAQALSVLCASLRRWMLLSLWGLPLNTAQVSNVCDPSVVDN